MHQNKNQNNQNPHTPVLLEQVLQYLDPKSGESYLDLTAGYGGHAKAILQATGNYAESVLVDRDEKSQAVLTELFGMTALEQRSQDYLTASQDLVNEGRQFALILADIGVSSPHLNDGPRGFSWQVDVPLDMRMDQRQSLTAETLVNTASEAELTRILKEYGEEPKARRIAHDIIANRPLHTTQQLAAIAAKAWPGHSRVHPATRTFQAIRIAVNDELNQLSAALPLWIQLLQPGGRLAVISFHSLEDRIVKTAFNSAGGDRYDADIRVLTKKPIMASPSEIDSNPRARSAKLRVVVKTKK